MTSEEKEERKSNIVNAIRILAALWAAGMTAGFYQLKITSHVAFQQIASLTEAQEKFLEANANALQFASAVNRTPVAIIICEAGSGVCIQASNTARKITGKRIVGIVPNMLIPEKHRAGIDADLWNWFDTEGEWHVVSAHDGGGMINRDGKRVPGEMRTTMYTEESGKSFKVLMFFPRKYDYVLEPETS